MNPVDLSFVEQWANQFLAALQVFQSEGQGFLDAGAVLLGLLAFAASFLFGFF
jgi:hypothetical protein